MMIGVVKIGGAEGNNLEPLTLELARRASVGESWVLVHGASGIMDRLCRERGVAIRMITSPSGYRSRFVGEAERAVFEEAAMAYGARITRMLGKLNAASEQIDPAATGSVAAKRKDVLRESVNGRIRIVRGNYSGTVTKVDPRPIQDALAANVIPVLPPLGFDAEASLDINIDGDRLAAAVASVLGAGVMIVLSNVPGLMKDVENPGSLIREGRLADWERLDHYSKGNMKRKMVACKEALEGGVPKVCLVDGRVADPIENALKGEATCLVR